MSDEDIFDVPDDDEAPSENAPKQPSNSEWARLRKELKEAKAAAKEAEELRAFKAEREKADREATVKTAFQELGLNPKHAKFYSGEGDVTPDAVRAWAVAEDFLQVEEGEAAEEPAPAAGFTPTVISEAKTVGSKVFSFDEFLELSKTDPGRANELWRAGRVEKIH